jgi:tRNA(Arg) A34 adenosine deaminase TadA
MKNPRKLLNLAAKFARLYKDNRTFALGAVALRSDDVMVSAYNGNPCLPEPRAHCEVRLIRKLDYGAVVYLARVTKNGQWANSKPCANCERALRRAKVKKVFYTSGPNEWGCFEP